MNRRRCAAVSLASGMVLLAGACGSSGSAPTLGAVPAASSPTSAASSTTPGRQPCSRPATMKGFLKLTSATATQTGTRLGITIVTCSVDPANDEDVEYAPVSTASVLVRPGAQIQVLTPGNNLETVDASWLTSHQVVNTPYFYYQETPDHQITAMQEIYHP